jgi:hypothetical protein
MSENLKNDIRNILIKHQTKNINRWIYIYAWNYDDLVDELEEFIKNKIKQ